ncbi:mechanosensory transduction mediator stumble [Choristoneura fumiferana]|uniref:mechanosensory transduction mediator stumble n=1 Tax=Choristoneura fumiferana TaxID=7141 RepID=UPI003D155EEB
MALKLKYTDEHGILHINMSPSASPRQKAEKTDPKPEKSDLTDPKFDTINNRFAQYDLFGGKYEVEGEPPSLFRSRYNSIEEELANTPYAFTAERSLRLDNSNNNLLDITIKQSLEASPSKDIENDRFFRNLNLEYDDNLFGPQIDFQSSLKTDSDESPAFTVTQLIHAQDRYFDLSSRQSSSVVDSPRSGKVVFEVQSASAQDEAFKLLPEESVKAALPVVPTSKRKRESSFAILAEAPGASRPSSPRSLPVESRTGRVSPFKGRGFREETSRHNTPKTSAANSRANSPPRRRTNSLSKIDKMATATLPPPFPLLRPHSPRNFLKENKEEVRELSELNREKHEAEEEQKRIEEEGAILKEMGILDKNASADVVRSVVGSRAASRCNSPSKINLKSRSSSPVAILHYENIPTGSKDFVNPNDGLAKPVTHVSRIRAVSRSQPQSNNGSPQHSKIPKRQSSVSPKRTVTLRDVSSSRKPVENNLNRSQRFISNSTSSIHETIRIGGGTHDKRNMSKSTQHLTIAPAVIKGKPPISPGRGGPPPSNRSINAKRLSPIVGTPNKSPDDLKPSSAKTPKPSPLAKKPIKTAGNTPATSRLNSRQPSRTVSRDQSPEKRRPLTKISTSSKPPTRPAQGKPVNRSSSTRLAQKPSVPKTDVKKPINRTNSMKSLVRTPSTKTLNEKPPLLKKDSRKDIKVKAQSTTKLNEIGTKIETVVEENKSEKAKKSATKEKTKDKKEEPKIEPVVTDDKAGAKDEVTTQDNETQYDKIVNENGEIVLLTKKSVISMTTAAITAQPLEVVTKVTNQLPAALEKAREKAIFERLSSKDSLAPKAEEKEVEPEKEKDKEKDKDKEKPKEKAEDKDSKDVEEKHDDKKAAKPAKTEKSSVFLEDNIKLKPLLPPYSNPQVERVRQKIDDILKSPEVSTENILAASLEARESRSKIKSAINKTKDSLKETKNDIAAKGTDIKDQAAKESDKAVTEIRSEATKIVDSIITPVEEPKKPEVPDKLDEPKKTIEPIVMVVNEKKNGPTKREVAEKINETLVKGEPEVEVQSSNVSSPGDKMAVQNKMADGNDSDKSAQSNGGFPQSTSTTPKPPARAHRQSKEEDKDKAKDVKEVGDQKASICSRLAGKCRQCCRCGKPEDDEKETKDVEGGLMSKLNCCKGKKEEEQRIRDVERAAGKAAVDFENETKRKRKLRDLCCGRRRVSDVSAPYVSDPPGCCGRRRPPVERRDSILSDREPSSCCNNRLCTWLRGVCRRRSEPSSSRRTSLFSKNKSLSPTLPPEDTRKKLDPSLVEHTSMMRAAIPALPLVLAFWCLLCNVLLPGLGTIFSGMFCLCFGIPRFGVHDGAKHRIGSFLINLLVGCGQLFTVLFCLVGWGWSIWWGVIMVRVSRKYRKLKAESAAEEAEAPPVTSNNHTARA